MTGISKKLNLWLIFITLVFFAVLSAVEYHAGLLRVEHEIDQSLEIISRRLSISLRLSVYEFDSDTIKDSVFAEFPNADVYAITVWTPGKQRLLSGMVRKDGKITNIYKSPEGNHLVFKKQDIFAVGSSGGLSNEKIGEFEVYIDRRVAKKRLLSDIIRSLAKIVLIVVLLLVLLALITNRFIAEPLDQIRLAMLNIKDAFPRSADPASLSSIPEKLFPESLAPAFSEVQEIGTVLENMVMAIKSRQESLREASEFREKILSESPIGITIYETGSGQCVAANKSMAKLIGASVEQVLAQSFYDIESWKKSGLLETAKTALRDNANKEREVTITTTFEKKMSADCHFAPFSAGDKEYLLFTLSDITERKEAEEEREKLVKTLEYKNNELRDIVYTTSHDLKSPLVNIEGFSGELNFVCDDLLMLLADQDKGEDKRPQIETLLKDNIPESLKYITGSTKKMASLLNGLLQISRVGTVEIKSESIDMNKIMGEVLAAMEHQIKEYNISVTHEPLANCVGDPDMLNTVFSNLIGTGIKFRHQAKEGEIRISCEVKDGVIIYGVADNGIGIALNTVDTHAIFNFT